MISGFYFTDIAVKNVQNKNTILSGSFQMPMVECAKTRNIMRFKKMHN